ncbi:MAG: Asp/Glu racemase [Litoreibacter sp.]|nr:Asp/Glu racemase [Litoreibacter sp.]
MTAFPYSEATQNWPRLGLIVLQSDETIEQDFRAMFPRDTALFTTRIESGLEVSADSLAAMEARLTDAATLFPRGMGFDVIGYGCTSGTAQIGASRIAELVRAGAPASQVTEPVSALISACDALGVKRLAILSPYVEEVSERLRAVLAHAGVETPVFGSFAEPEEAKVARIDTASIVKTGVALVASGEVDALFLSCTNLRSLPAIPLLEEETGLPVLSSNQVLAWEMARLAGLPFEFAPNRGGAR